MSRTRTVHYHSPGKGILFNCVILAYIEGGKPARTDDLKKWIKWRGRPMSPDCPHWDQLIGPTENDRVILMDQTGVTHLVPVLEQYLPTLWQEKQRTKSGLILL